VRQVQENLDLLQTMAADKLVVRESGFLYVYTSNEGRRICSFEDVLVTSSSGPILEALIIIHLG
jgi:hypothetical protein